MQGGMNIRSRQILEAIIEDYISTAEPIGSSAIRSRHGLSLSAATIRNVMADLEEMGYLASPHTSAGRVPTDKAYRFYVDSLLAVKAVDRGEREEIRRRCSVSGRDVDGVFREISQMLSSVSHYMGMVAAPRFNANVFRQMEFVRLGSRRVLAILVSQSGTVQNRIIELDHEIQSEELVRMANYLNVMLQGLTISQVKGRILKEMESDKIQYDTLLAEALQLSRQAFDDSGTGLFIEGQANIFELPEFADAQKMKDIFRAMEQKGQLLDLLDSCLKAPGVNIFIGSESHLNNMSGMSLITSTYVSGKNTLGVLGVIGPTRMGYGKVIPIVDYTAKMLTRLLNVE
ncbi:MAG TPA: heat-inducible transcriptional repressor HrcA [Geobacteraceae bacterium]|nr:heat-inducible transcriptional repressor HrcA [Geobacteraceae bacterium]